MRADLLVGLKLMPNPAASPLFLRETGHERETSGIFVDSLAFADGVVVLRVPPRPSGSSRRDRGDIER
jgi:hypothetical protein